MVAYRLYRVDEHGRVLGPPQTIHCQNDEAVLVEARQYVDGKAIEVWRDCKQVGVLPAEE